MDFTGDVDFDIRKHTYSTLTDITKADIMNDDPQGPQIFRNAIYQQVMALCHAFVIANASDLATSYLYIELR